MIFNARRNSLYERGVQYNLIAKKLREIKLKKMNFKVLNVGGSLDRYNLPVDAIFDIRGSANKKSTSNIKVYPFDICKKNSWDSIKNNEYDYVVCTHTLEDVRDPFFVIEQLQRVAKAGYIAVPSKTRELQFCRSYFHIGYAHHRWIFTIRKNTLLMMPKFSFVEFLVRSKQIPWVTLPTEPKLINILRFIFYKIKSIFGKNKDIFQFSADKVDDYEIAFEWKNTFKFKLIADDLFLPPYKNSIVDEYIDFGKGL